MKVKLFTAVCLSLLTLLCFGIGQTNSRSKIVSSCIMYQDSRVISYGKKNLPFDDTVGSLVDSLRNKYPSDTLVVLCLYTFPGLDSRHENSYAIRVGKQAFVLEYNSEKKEIYNLLPHKHGCGFNNSSITKGDEVISDLLYSFNEDPIRWNVARDDSGSERLRVDYILLKGNIIMKWHYSVDKIPEAFFWYKNS